MSKKRTEASPSEKVIRVVNVAAGAHLRLPDWGTTRTNEKTKGVTAPARPAPVSAQRVGRGDMGGEASGPEVLPPLLYILIRELLYI